MYLYHRRAALTPILVKNNRRISTGMTSVVRPVNASGIVATSHRSRALPTLVLAKGKRDVA
jgi:hypothetical protein